MLLHVPLLVAFDTIRGFEILYFIEHTSEIDSSTFSRSEKKILLSNDKSVKDRPFIVTMEHLNTY